jgi:hypothetical protein
MPWRTIQVVRAVRRVILFSLARVKIVLPERANKLQRVDCIEHLFVKLGLAGMIDIMYGLPYIL